MIEAANADETNHFTVDWDGPDDPNNPKKSDSRISLGLNSKDSTPFHSWSFRKKWAATALASAYTFLSPVSSAMIAPAMSNIAAEFHIRSSVEVVLTVSIFVLAYGTSKSSSTSLHDTLVTDALRYPAFGPLLFAPLSEIYGRVRLLQSTNVLYLGGWEES